MTLRDLEPLADQFKLIFLDPPGTGGARPPETLTYDTLLYDIESSLASLDLPLILLGHSFGGIQAMNITVQKKVKVQALIVMATPFTQNAFKTMQAKYLQHRNEEMVQAENEFEQNPSVQTFLNMNLAYWPYYFTERTKEKGCALLRSDQSCYQTLLAATADGQNKGHLLADLKRMNIPKLFLAGEKDLMFPIPVLKQEAELGGFEFMAVSQAGHFVSSDAPAATINAIRKFAAEKFL